MTLNFINKPQELAMLDALASAQRVGVDIETAGEDGLDPFLSRIRLVQVAIEGETYVIDCDRVDPIPHLKTVFEDESIVKILHNAKFDLKHIYHHKAVELKPVFCTYLASQLLARGNREQRHSLHAVVQRTLGIALDKSMQISDWSGPVSDAQIEYAAMDAEILLQLHPIMEAELARFKLRRVSQLEFRTVMPVAAMELRGMRVDLERWDDMERQLVERKDRLESHILSELRLPDDLPGMNTLNLNAPDQIRDALLEIGIRVEGTAESNLKRHIGDHWVIKELLEYRHVSRVLGSTIRQIREMISSETGRVHPSYHQIASASGRFACSAPNIQQVPREARIREAFVPRDGYRFVIADYSQVELRVAAGMSADEIMLRAYAQGEDLHRLTAALTMDKPASDVTRNERQAAKAINFGLIYAMGPKGLMQSASMSYGVDMSLEQATRFRDRYFQNYAGIKAWQDRLAEQGRRVRYVRTAAGRIRAYENEEVRVTELFNIPVQGTAAEGLKSALCLFWEAAKSQRLDASIIAIIHDEIIVEVRADQAEHTRETLVTCMVDGMSWLVPNVSFEVDALIGDSWAAKS